MNRESFRVAQLVVLAGALGLSAVAPAALKDKPPKDVTFTGTAWNIDPYRSDDPKAVIDKAEDAQRSERDSTRQGDMDRGVFGGGRGTAGRSDSSEGTWGRGGYPDSDRRGVPGGIPDRRRSDVPGGDFPDGTRGGWGHDHGGTSTDVDPTGSSQSASVKLGSLLNGFGNEFLGQLSQNPGKLTFLQVNDHVTVSADKVDTECAAGAKVPISDLYGDGERRCGWDGRAWVVETKRGSRFSRTDRYELSKDGKTLNYTTTASGARMPKIRISRTYTVAPAATPGA
jgi:hypothetical protein